MVKFNDNDEDIKDQMNTLDLAFCLGLGYETDKVQITGRYNAGLSNTAKDSGDFHYPNNVIQISLGISLGE